MWYGLVDSSGPDHAFKESALELLESTIRTLILTAIGLCAIWELAILLKPPEDGDLLASPLLLFTIVISVITLRILSRNLLSGFVFWQAGLIAIILLGVRLFQDQNLGFLLLVVPLITTVSIGWIAGVLAEGVILFVACLLFSGLLAPPMQTSHALALAVGGGVACVIGWASTRSLYTMTQWSLAGWKAAQQSVEEARDQRLDLVQVQEDLQKANYELARLTGRLKSLHQVAEEARQAKEEFVANVSHELRTPLNMIIGFSEMITRSPEVYGKDLPPALLADITSIQRNSQHLTRLVDDVLDLSQAEAGRMVLNREWVNMRDMAETAAQGVQALFESKGLYLRVTVSEDLPRVFCDSTRVRQVILNLLSNAGRFTHLGGVTLAAKRDGDQIEISLVDTGPGISPADQARIFEPFQQLDASIRRIHGGSGLGLSISKRFVEMHDGRMWLESELGQGTTFHFSLPIEGTPLDSNGSDQRVRRAFNPYLPYQDRTRRSKAFVPQVVPRYILLDKGDSLYKRASHYVDQAELTHVETIQDAVTELQRSPANALIVNMPSVIELVNSGQVSGQLPYGTPIVTCWVPGEEETAQRLGVVRYLVKPVTNDTLQGTLEKLGSGIRTILLVDDDEELLRLFSRMLVASHRNYRVLRADSGQRALSLLRHRRPDVMLLDLILPDMNGFQILEEKSRDPAIRDIPVIVVSSRDAIGDPIVSQEISISRSGGLSVRDIFNSIQAVSEVLAPAVPQDHQGQPRNHSG